MPLMRLLPPGHQFGITPYLWLVYAGFYAVFPFVAHPSRARMPWWGHAAGLVAFLALYFRGYWVDGQRRLPIIVGLTVLGVALTPVNSGALSFFVFACAFVGGARTGASAVRWIAGITLVGAASATTAVWYHWTMPLSVAVFAPLIGTVNLQAAEGRRRNVSLRVAQDEVARLAVQGERHRIAADLHDVLGHTLSVIVLKAELATKLADRDPEAARAEMADVERIAREALASTRKVVTGIQTTTLKDEFLRVRTVLADAGVTLQLDPRDGCPDVQGLPAPTEHALAMVAREAVTNVLRHARAASCRLTVMRTSSQVEMEIEDDGVGGEVHEGNGIRGMRARLAEVGGSLDITRATANGRGTRLRAAVPAAGATS